MGQLASGTRVIAVPAAPAPDAPAVPLVPATERIVIGGGSAAVEVAVRCCGSSHAAASCSTSSIAKLDRFALLLPDRDASISIRLQAHEQRACQTRVFVDAREVAVAALPNR